LDHQFETIDLTQLEHVAGGGAIARKIKGTLKKMFEGKAVTTKVNFLPARPSSISALQTLRPSRGIRAHTTTTPAAWPCV
jgi:hypothetical protein